MGGAAFCLIAALALCWPTAVYAETSAGQTAGPAPYWAKSIEVVNDGAPIMVEPGNEGQNNPQGAYERLLAGG